MKNKRIQWFFIILFVTSLFLGTYLYRKHRDDDIKAHSKFAVGKIIKFTTSLKSGNSWHYEFKYGDTIFQGSRSTHVDYDVKMGEYFLVNFSTKDPDHSKILYDYKLNRVCSATP